LAYQNLHAFPLALLFLDGLCSLGMDNNAMSGSIPPELARLTELSSLQLGFNAFSGSIPPELAGLTRLKTLRLAANPKLGGALPAFNFSQFTSCCSMNGIPVACPLPPGAQGCVGGPACNDKGSRAPPTCK
jgi:hypothetical protein